MVCDFHPGNLDAFSLRFDLGIGLHCCGSFTDMVMEICARQGASCIVCPCCNGKMTAGSSGGMRYPRSAFLEKFVTEEAALRTWPSYKDQFLGQISRSADDRGNYTAKCVV